MIKKDLGSPDIPYMGHLLAGVDEAGRGPLAGDVVAAAVILDPLRPIAGLADSKKLTEKKREVLFDQIHQQALAVAIGRANVTEIDQLNILWASMLAMGHAFSSRSLHRACDRTWGRFRPRVHHRRRHASHDLPTHHWTERNRQETE